MSSTTTLARPYARAAFQAGKAADALQDWSDMLAVSAAISADAQVADALVNPSVSDETRVSLVSPENSSDAFTALLTLLAENDRLPLLGEIHEQFDALKRASEQTVKVTVTSAVALDKTFQKKLVASLGKRFDADIEIEYETDEALLGGAIIRAGNDVIDQSIRGQLSRMASALV